MKEAMNMHLQMKKPYGNKALAILAAVIVIGTALPAGADETVTVNSAQKRQTIIAWGASGIKTLPDKLVAPFIDEAVNGMGLNRLRYEPPGEGSDGDSRWEYWNDDGNPGNTVLSQFNTARVDDKINRVIKPFKQKVEANGEPFNLYVSPSFFDGGSTGPVPVWLLNSPGEHAEFLTSILLYLKNAHNITADYCTILNEAGNHNPFTAAVVGKMIKTLGPKLQALGLATKIELPECVDAQTSWNYIQTLQNDTEIWPYVGIISYHLYGTNDPYRSNIRDFAVGRSLPTAQSEYIGLTVNHLYDDLTLGGVSSWEWYGRADYMPTNSSGTWFSRTSEYWKTRQIIRYVRPGAARVDASSSSPSIRPLAFEKDGKITVVLLNNTGGAATNVAVNGLPAGTYGICRTVSGAAYQEQGLQTLAAPGTLTVNVPTNNAVVTIYPYAGTNQPPTVTDWKANPPYLAQPASSTALSSSATDPELDAISYQWSVVSQPAGANVSLATPDAASTNATGLTVAGDYVFAVAVSDPTHTVTRQIEFTVFSDNQPPQIRDLHNRDPVLVTLPASGTTLRAVGKDLENDPLTYQWTVISQPAGASASLAAPTTTSCDVSNMTVAGDYVFQFTVNDPTHSVSSQITVPVYPVNQAPVISSATATPATVALPVSGTTLAAVTSDPDPGAIAAWRPGGDVLTHWWTVKSCPSGAAPVFADPGSRDTTVSGLTVAGDYVFTLATIDRTIVTTRDVTVTVTGASNQPPVANAGPDQVVTDADANGSENVALNGTGSSDPDGTIVGYEWKEGVNQIAAGATPSVSLSVGVHTITLTVTDNLGAMASDTVQITVNAPQANQPPVAADQNVATTKNTAKAIVLSATDPDGNPLTYAVVAQPTHGTLSGTTPNITYTPVTDYVGSDSFTFKANDGQADSNVATISITVSDGQQTLTVFSAVGDGRCEYWMPVDSGPGQSQWDTAHNADSSGVDYTTAVRSNWVSSGCMGNNAVNVCRGFLVFDTSALPDNAVITGAAVKVFIYGKKNSKNDGNDFLTVVEGRQASTSELVGADYVRAGNAVHNVTEGSNRIDITGITTDAYTTWTLNQTGLTWISKTDWTKLSVREGHDVLDVWAGYANQQGNYVSAYMSEQAGTAQDPTLVITYTVPPANLPPVASISATPMSGDAPLAVAFDGSASSDPDGTIATYSWDFGDGQNASGAQVNHTFTNPGNYIATLYVTDDKGAIASTSVMISAIQANQIPVAVAGVLSPGYTVVTGTQVTLNGAGSSDPDNYPSGGIQSYDWQQTAGPAITLQNSGTMTPTFTPSEAGVYTFKLVVNDGQADSTDASSPNNTVTVTVQPTPNQLPVAVAGVQGPGQTVSVGTQVTLTGAGSFDPDNYPSGGIQSYSWQQTGGPAVTLQNANGVNPTFTPAEAGAYTFKLTVNDGQDDSTDASSPSNTITITVEADTTPPTLDVTTVVLKGTVGDTDSGVASVTVDGQPAAVNGSQWEKEMPVSPGVNTFTVVVTDNEGNQTTRQVQVTK